MSRDTAISYLQRKGKIRNPDKIIGQRLVIQKKVKKVVTYVNPKFTKEEEAEIEQVMSEGKIYGDPVANIRW